MEKLVIMYQSQYNDFMKLVGCLPFVSIKARDLGMTMGELLVVISPKFTETCGDAEIANAMCEYAYRIYEKEIA